MPGCERINAYQVCFRYWHNGIDLAQSIDKVGVRDRWVMVFIAWWFCCRLFGQCGVTVVIKQRIKYDGYPEDDDTVVSVSRSGAIE